MLQYTLMSSLVLYLGIYFALLFGLVIWAKRGEKDADDYLMAGRNRPWWQLFLSKFAGMVGVAWFVTYTGFAYEFGVGVFAILFGAISGALVFAWWGIPRIFALARKYSFYTQGDFVEHATGSRFARIVSDSVAIVTQGMWLMITIVGGGKIISHYGLMSYEWAVILTGGVVLGYILLAGFRAVIITDIIQSVVIVALLSFIAFVVLGDTPLPQILAAGRTPFSALNVVGFALFGTLSFFSLSDRYQLAYAGASEKAAKRGIGWSFVPIVLVASLLLAIGLFMKVHAPGVDTGLVFLEALSRFLSPELLPLAIVLFFAGLMSSADTNVYTIASQAAFLIHKEKPVRTVQYATIATVVLMVIAGLIFRNIIDLTLVASAATLILSIPMIYLLAGGKKWHVFVATTLGAVVGFPLGLSLFGLEPSSGVFIAGTSVVFFVVSLVVWRKKKPQTPADQ